MKEKDNNPKQTEDAPLVKHTSNIKEMRKLLINSEQVRKFRGNNIKTARYNM